MPDSSLPSPLSKRTGAGEAFRRMMGADPVTGARVLAQLRIFVASLQAVLSNPEHAAARKQLEKTQRRLWRKLAAAIRAGNQRVGDELAARHFRRPECLEDWEHLARIVELPVETIRTGNWTPREVFEHALAWADRQIIRAKLVVEAEQAAKPPASTASEADLFVLERSGDGWRIEAFGERGHFRDALGFQYIAKLLQKPNLEIPVELLVRNESAMPARNAAADCDELSVDGRSVQYIADGKALEAYRQRLKELDAEIAEAERRGCAAEAEELQREREALLDTIKEAYAPGGRRRAFGSAGDKLRPSVYGALKRAYKQMRKAKPAMMRTAEHLELSIVCENGAFVYRGVSLPSWRVIL